MNIVYIYLTAILRNHFTFKDSLTQSNPSAWNWIPKGNLTLRYICMYIRCIWYIYMYILLNCLTHFSHILLLCIWYDMKVVGDTYLNETLTMRFKFPFHLFLIFQTKRLMYHTHTQTLTHTQFGSQNDFYMFAQGEGGGREGTAGVLASPAVCHVLVKLKTITYSNLLLLCCTSFKLLLLLFPYKVSPSCGRGHALSCRPPVWVYFN